LNNESTLNEDIGESSAKSMNNVRGSVPTVDYFQDFDLATETVGQLTQRIMAERDQLKELGNKSAPRDGAELHQISSRGPEVLVDVVDEERLLDRLLESEILQVPREIPIDHPPSRAVVYGQLANQSYNSIIESHNNILAAYNGRSDAPETHRSYVTRGSSTNYWNG